MTDAEKERIKLTATHVNGLAIAIFAVAPIFSALYSIAAPALPVWVVLLSALVSR